MKRKEFLGLSAAALAGAALPTASPARPLPRGSSAGAGPARVETAFYELRLRHAWTLSRGTWNTRRNLFVRYTRDGVSGFGEAAPLARYQETAESARDFVAKARPLLESRDPREYHDLWLELDALAPGEHAAKAALDIALLDWTGKALGVPFHRLLGLSPAWPPVTTYSIAIDEVPAMQARVKEAPGFAVYKIKLGTADDRKIVEGIRAVTDKPLRVDANEGWTSKEQALEMIQWLAGRGVELVEQPLPAARLDDLAWVTERAPLPVFADESLMTSADLPRIAGAFRGVNVKLMKCGGPQEAVRLAAAGRALGLKLMLGCMIESSLGIAAGAALSPLFDDVDLDGNLLVDNDPFRGVTLRDGRQVVSEAAGMGVSGDVWG